MSEQALQRIRDIWTNSGRVYHDDFLLMDFHIRDLRAAVEETVGLIQLGREHYFLLEDHADKLLKLLGNPALKPSHPNFA